MTTTATTQGVTPVGGVSTTPDHAPAGVATHCAYCGLQCAMTLTGSSAADLTVDAAPLPDQPGRPVPEGLDERRAAPHTGAPHDPARAP